jgi:hypothetical protein
MGSNSEAANRAHAALGQPSVRHVPEASAVFTVLRSELTAGNPSDSAESLARRWCRRTIEQPATWLFYRCFWPFLSRQDRKGEPTGITYSTIIPERCAIVNLAQEAGPVGLSGALRSRAGHITQIGRTSTVP